MSDSMTGPAQTTDTSQDPPQPGANDDRTYRILKWVVIVMGVLLVVGFVVIVIGMISKIQGFTGANRAAALQRVSAPYEAAVTLPAGARIVETAVGDGLVVLRLETPGGPALLLVDPRTGRARGTVTLTPAE
ncbi:MAG: DUF6476 family protein [Alphaproteobacteria bacterium]|nr:DUF6476 family protein [Alphaproteobacteria bacterium]MDX5369555.1 DUF6476 family protein [Alphaproteobacteria bacterium]MDX5464209.1 DUF6476 family protein [Alphaproteobacteria bacterium]